MGNGPNLWWVYDSDNGSFSTLPTGPMLLPALLVMGLAALFSSRPRTKTFKENAGKLARTPEWQAKHARYQELVRMYVSSNGDLELEELNELRLLEKYLYNPHGFST